MKNLKEKVSYIIGALIGLTILIVVISQLFGPHEAGQAFRSTPLWMKLVSLLCFGSTGLIIWGASTDRIIITKSYNTDMFIIIAGMVISVLLGFFFLFGFYRGVL